MTHRNNFARTLIAASLLFPSVCLLAQTGQPAPSQQSHREMPKPTNLQVLPKNISSEDLMATMHQFTGDLGVHCTFCHAEDSRTHHPDFASDAKPEKLAARVMMRMTHDINEKYLTQLPDHGSMMQVSCGTCHRGHSMPEAFTPAPEKHTSSPRKK